MLQTALFTQATLLFASLADSGGGTWDLARIAKWVLISLGILVIAVIVSRVLGFVIPQWVWQIVGVVAAVFLGIIAINFLASM